MTTSSVATVWTTKYAAVRKVQIQNIIHSLTKANSEYPDSVPRPFTPGLPAPGASSIIGLKHIARQDIQSRPLLHLVLITRNCFSPNVANTPVSSSTLPDDARGSPATVLAVAIDGWVIGRLSRQRSRRSRVCIWVWFGVGHSDRSSGVRDVDASTYGYVYHCAARS